MPVDPIQLNSGGLSNQLLIGRVPGGGSGASDVYRKSFGEPIPKIADIHHNAELRALFSQMGMLGRLEKKLRMLSRKKGRIVPAKGTIACALSACDETENEDLVFVGVDFAQEYKEEEETIAGVLAHEWGHLTSEFPHGINPDELSWEEIFALRKSEECNADAYAGRMLYLMRYAPEGLIRFLSKPKYAKETHKYHSSVTRAAIIQRAYQHAQRQQQQIQNFNLIPNATFRNLMTAQLIGVA